MTDASDGDLNVESWTLSVERYKRMRILSGIQPSGVLHMNLSFRAKSRMERLGRATWTVARRGQPRESREANESNLLLLLQTLEEIQNKQLRFFDSAQNDR